jgi:hypothetical protein
MTEIVERLRKSYPCRNQDEDDTRTKTTDTCVDLQAVCMCEYEDRKEAADEIERLRSMVEAHHTQWLNAQKMIKARDKEIERQGEALAIIWAWYSTDVSNPHDQIKKMKKFAYLSLNEDFRKYFEDHYAALKGDE